MRVLLGILYINLVLALPVVFGSNLDLEESLQAELLQSYKDRGPGYIPRTAHIDDDGTPQYINRLIREESPYLLQHAHNPVNWFPWGKEAFDKAINEDKPVFLSIGYATCHWCHVMERESFENKHIAAQINDQFVAIKVDREQLPDIDAMYMQGIQEITGIRGWPLSGFLMPDGKLFHGATYLTPDEFSSVMNQLKDSWVSDRERLTEDADKLAIAIKAASILSGEAKVIGDTEIEIARENLLLEFDDFDGGFGPAPKFPRESTLFFLLDVAQRYGDEQALEAVDFSLTRMSAGGIHDQVGGGFHRYAIDSDWLTPHFEKMLYTQANLLQVYLQAFELTGSQEHARTARRIADYVIREMTAEAGGFYSATDADSEGHEGSYFVWTLEELTRILSDSFNTDEVAFALKLWGVSEHGNFEGKNILRLEDSLENIADSYDMEEQAFVARLNAYSQAILSIRDERSPPLTDRKIITEWNAQMSTALLKAGRILREPRYMRAGTRAVEFLIASNLDKDGSLRRAQFEGRSTIPASQADYAYLSQALLTLFDETGNIRWLDLVPRIVNKMNEYFWDAENGGYFIGSSEASGAILPVRPKALFDSASPSGNAVALKVLVQLYNRTGKEKYRQQAERLVTSFSQAFSQNINGLGYFLTGTNDLLNGEISAHRYAARGKVKVSAVSTSRKTISIEMDIAPGWHVNSNEPLQDYLIPTQLTLSDQTPLERVQYPTAVSRKLGFQRSELNLFEGSVQLTASLPDELANTVSAEVTLQLQACSDSICLAPEILSLFVPKSLPQK